MFFYYKSDRLVTDGLGMQNMLFIFCLNLKNQIPLPPSFCRLLILCILLFSPLSSADCVASKGEARTGNSTWPCRTTSIQIRSCSPTFRSKPVLDKIHNSSINFASDGLFKLRINKVNSRIDY